MAKFHELSDDQRGLVVRALEMAVEGLQARASRATVDAVKKAFEAEADRFSAVRVALVMTK